MVAEEVSLAKLADPFDTFSGVSESNEAFLTSTHTYIYSISIE